MSIVNKILGDQRAGLCTARVKDQAPAPLILTVIEKSVEGMMKLAGIQNKCTVRLDILKPENKTDGHLADKRWGGHGIGLSLMSQNDVGCSLSRYRPFWETSCTSAPLETR